MIEVFTPERTGDSRTRVEFQPSFLNSGYGRKLYVVAEGDRLPIPSSGKAHAHTHPDYLVPLQGTSLLAYRRPDGQVEVMRLEPGNHYRIPPLVPHQVEVRGGMLESFYPTVAYEQQIPTMESGDSLFEQHAEELKGGSST